MTTKEAISFFEKRGCKVYDRGNNLFSLWHGGNHTGDYSARKLIKFAMVHVNAGTMGHKDNGKYYSPRPNCPCCMKLPKNELKIATARYDRRKAKQNIKNIEKSLDNEE